MKALALLLLVWLAVPVEARDRSRYGSRSSSHPYRSYRPVVRSCATPVRARTTYYHRYYHRLSYRSYSGGGHYFGGYGGYNGYGGYGGGYYYQPPERYYSLPSPPVIYSAPSPVPPAPVASMPAPLVIPTETVAIQGATIVIPQGFRVENWRFHKKGNDAGLVDWVRGSYPNGRRAKLKYDRWGRFEEDN